MLEGESCSKCNAVLPLNGPHDCPVRSPSPDWVVGGSLVSPWTQENNHDDRRVWARRERKGEAVPVLFELVEPSAKPGSYNRWTWAVAIGRGPLLAGTFGPMEREEAMARVDAIVALADEHPFDDVRDRLS